MNSSLSAGMNGPETPLDTASTSYYPGTEGDSELIQTQDTLLKSLRTLAKSTRRRAAVLKVLLPEYDRAQKRYSLQSKSHVTLPKGCTWSKIKVWMIESAGLEMSLRQLERALEELRDPGRKAKKNAATARRKQQKDELIKLAKGIVKAYRTGKDVRAAIEAFEREDSRQNAPTDDLEPVSARVTATEAEPEPADTGKDPDIAVARPRETALVPVAMADQFQTTSNFESCAESSSGSTVIMTGTMAVKSGAALKLTQARSERRSKTTSGNSSGDHVHTASRTLKPGPDATESNREEPGDAADHAEAVIVPETKPISAAEPPKAKVTQSTCVSIDSRRPARAAGAGVQIPVNPASPKSTDSELTGSANETIFCVNLEASPDGECKAVAHPVALARIRKAGKRKEHLLSGAVDLFHPSVSFIVIREILSSVRAPQESYFRIFTAHPERMHEYAEWEKSQDHLWHFPINLTLSVVVQSGLELERLDVFAEVIHQLKSVSFAGFKSDLSHPLTPGNLMPRLVKCELREILVEANPARGAQSLTGADAECLALIAGQRALSEYVVAL